jgi:hypothetical protein
MQGNRNCNFGMGLIKEPHFFYNTFFLRFFLTLLFPDILILFIIIAIQIKL